MKVGILIPVYNAQEYLQEAIDSVVAQTYENIAIYIRDDLSTDGSRKIINKYQSLREYNIIADNYGNLGWAGNFNLLAKTAIRDDCDAIYIMSADDLMTPTLIDRMVKEIETGFDFVCCDATIFQGGKRVHTIIGKHQPKPMCTWEEFRHNNWLTSFAMFTADAWDAMGGYDTKVGGYEDWELWIRLLKAGYRYNVIQTPLYWYRDHNTQTSKKVPKEHCINYILKKHYENTSNGG